MILFIRSAILESLLLYIGDVGMLKPSFSEEYMFAGMNVMATVATQPVTGNGVSVWITTS